MSSIIREIIKDLHRTTPPLLKWEICKARRANTHVSHRQIKYFSLAMMRAFFQNQQIERFLEETYFNHISMKPNRRKFIQSTGALAGGILLGGAKFNHDKVAGVPNLIKIDVPFHGAILNHRCGEKADKGLKVLVQGEAPLSSKMNFFI